MIIQKELIKQTGMREDEARELIKRLVAAGTIQGPTIEKDHHNRKSFTDQAGKKILEAAATVKAKARAGGPAADAVEGEKYSPDSVTAGEAPAPLVVLGLGEAGDHEVETIDKAEPIQPQEPAPSALQVTKAKGEATTLRELARAPGPESRIPAKPKSKSDDEDEKQGKKTLGLSSSTWLWIGLAAAGLTLVFLFMRRRRATQPENIAQEQGPSSTGIGMGMGMRPAPASTTGPQLPPAEPGSDEWLKRTLPRYRGDPRLN